MTAKELAAMLDGAEYGHEVSREIAKQAKEAGLVIVYGASDDLMEFEGAIEHEAGVYEGGSVHVASYGVLMCPECDTEWRECPYWKRECANSKVVTAVWCGANTNAAWSYETDVPHACFNVYEDGELYCTGIVFSVEDL